MLRTKFLLLFLLVAVIVLFTGVPRAQASVLDSVVHAVKGIFGVKSSPVSSLTVTSSIVLAPNGDVNKNGQIDAGDFVRFSYTITNTTSNTYLNETLKTNISRNSVNIIHNLIGAMNLDDTHNNTITIPYINMGPNQVRMISFDARVNYFKDVDRLLSTQPVLVDAKNAILSQSQKHEAKIKKLDVTHFNEFVHIKK